jgi:gamma-glutamyltranspeptidase/glutathione hydrolase
MRELLKWAIHYARDGFPVADETASVWKTSETKLRKYPNAATVYFPDDRPLQRGELFRNPQLANTLEKIADSGRDAFYKGEIASVIESYMKKNGGYLTAKDLADHQSNWVDPVSTVYRGFRVWELPPNGQGIAVLEMLNIFEGFDFSKISYGSAEDLHLFTEAKKLAYEDRAKYYADPDFAKTPVVQLISKKYAEERRKLIRMDRASEDFSAGDAKLTSGETVYLTVADDEGNMISLIQSNFNAYGSGLVPDGLGFALQNRGSLFNLQEGMNNTYAPHKRPFHTIIPAFVTKDDQPIMSFGVMGGAFQVMGQVEVLMNMIDFGMNEQEAGDAPDSITPAPLIRQESERGHGNHPSRIRFFRGSHSKIKIYGSCGCAGTTREFWRVPVHTFRPGPQNLFWRLRSAQRRNGRRLLKNYWSGRKFRTNIQGPTFSRTGIDAFRSAFPRFALAMRE